MSREPALPDTSKLARDLVRRHLASPAILEIQERRTLGLMGHDTMPDRGER